jgi:hypothetical protein
MHYKLALGELGMFIVNWKSAAGLAALAGISMIFNHASAETIAACEQTIQYNVIAPQADVPDAARAFSGVWTGTWGNQLCHVLVVEEIAKDGTVAAKYAYGTNPGWGIRQAGVRQWSGKISGNTLMLRGNNLSVDYKLVNAGTLAGTYSSATGQSAGDFKKR